MGTIHTPGKPSGSRNAGRNAGWSAAAFTVAAFAVLLASFVSARAASAGILTKAELQQEMLQNEALRSHIRHSGYPDLAQRWPVHSELPWDTYIVRLLYLDARKEVAFSRAYLLERPQIGVVRYRRPMTDEMAAELERFLATSPMVDADGELPISGDPAGRAELAANRAVVAAEMSELGAVAAERAAEQLETMAGKVERSFQDRLRK